jgi:MFS family permease
MQTNANAPRVVAKIWWRVVPVLSCGLLFAYIDKTNIGFAALRMNEALGLSNTQLGVAGGLFALGYAVAAVPSTLLLQRFGARRSMSIMMLLWGLCSAATALVSSWRELLIARIALGVAEAGFAPGAILYLTYWFPSEYRGRIIASFLLTLPVSLVIGGPLSAALLSWEGLWGLSGWRWLFVVEGLPTIVLGALTWRFLADGPSHARWLADAEKVWLSRRLADDRSAPATGANSLRSPQMLMNRRIILLAVAYMAIATSGSGMILFLPLLIHSIGFSISHTGLLTAAPALLAASAIPTWGVWTDRDRNRERLLATTCLVLASGLLGAAVLLPSAWALVPLGISSIGFFGAPVVFWTLPSSFLEADRAATGIAVINLAGNVGGFLGPVSFGWLLTASSSAAVGLATLSAIALCATLLIEALHRQKQPRTGAAGHT